MVTARRMHVHARHMARTSAPAGILLEPVADARLRSSTAPQLAQRLAGDPAELAELAKRDPATADSIFAALVAHLRSARLESVSPLGVLPPPGEVTRDRRDGR